MTAAGIAIIGGGIAGFRALQRIQELDPERAVTLISDEDGDACERPMLSKELLISNSDPRRIGPRMRRDRIEIIAGTRIDAIDRTARRLHTDAGRTIAYDRLILATGSRPRRLPADVAAPGLVRYLRTEADGRLLYPELCEGRHVVVIGGGFIGLEVAAAARQRGAEVTVIEMRPILLSRVAPSSVSSYVAAVHESRGVRLLTATSLMEVSRLASGRIAVATGGAGTVECDCCVAGIGVVPNVELAGDCGLRMEDGLLVDEHCRTSDPDIVAAGEVTNHPVPRLRMRARSESWTVASDQGSVAGESAIGRTGEGYDDLPWLWSDQYDMHIQYLGLPMAAERMTRHEGVTPTSWLEIGWSAEGRFLGAIGVNANREIAELRRHARKNLGVPDRYRTEMAG